MTRILSMCMGGLLVILAAVAAVSVPAGAAREVRPQPARQPLVVQPAWLADRLGDPALVVLHVGRDADYAGGHIPGARLVGVADISVRRGENTLEMPDPEALRGRLAALGISDDSEVLVYFGAGNAMTWATRVVLTLDYAGLGGRTRFLDGGLDAWTTAGHAVTRDVPAQVTGTLSPITPAARVVDAEWVRDRLDVEGVAVVDARTTAFYEGVQVGGGRETPHRTGHIAGAGSVPFSAVFDDAGRLRAPDALRALFAAAGVEPGDTVVGYCHIGQQATAMLLAARSLGYAVVLYDGSFEDWSRHPGYPVATGR